jgi:hypothetical protein
MDTKSISSFDNHTIYKVNVKHLDGSTELHIHHCPKMAERQYNLAIAQRPKSAELVKVVKSYFRDCLV